MLEVTEGALLLYAHNAAKLTSAQVTSVPGDDAQALRSDLLGVVHGVRRAGQRERWHDPPTDQREWHNCHVAGCRC